MFAATFFAATFTVQSIALLAFCLLAWIPVTLAPQPHGTRRFRFQGRFACGALTRFCYDAQGHLSYVAITAELHEESTANLDGESAAQCSLAAVNYVHYSEDRMGSRIVSGLASGGEANFQPTTASIRIPIDLFETTENLATAQTRESFLGSIEFEIQLTADGPAQYGPCRQVWHAPHSQLEFDATGLVQPVRAIDVSIDRQALAATGESVVSGMLMVGAGSVEERYRNTL